MPANNNDNRMAWIRSVEKINSTIEDTYYYEYEFASECRISGMLDYESGKILCGLFSLDVDKNGLYHYVLKVQYPKFEGGYNQNADKKGYYFKDGVIGELLSLFSLYFQCRFYLVATYSGELTSNGLKTKIEHDLIYRKVNKVTHPKIFSDSARSFGKGGLSDFLNKVRQLENKKHQNFILACHHYARSLKEIGVDSEMVFIRLVSAIETLSQDYKLTARSNPLDGGEFSSLFDSTRLSDPQNKQLREMLKVSKHDRIQIEKSKQKFIKFVLEFSKGCLRGGNWKARHVKITKKNLPDVLSAIYSARSSYLHSGEPMYLSQIMGKNAERWDTDPSVGMLIDNRKLSSSLKLPYTYWFENVVRHCLLQYLKSNSESHV